MSDRADALILPGDSAVPEIELKKSVLFFDSVTIANHKDVALVNESEVEEKFPGAVIRWSARNEFPREPDYVPKLEHLLANASALRKKRDFAAHTGTVVSIFRSRHELYVVA